MYGRKTSLLIAFGLISSLGLGCGDREDQPAPDIGNDTTLTVDTGFDATDDGSWVEDVPSDEDRGEEPEEDWPPTGIVYDPYAEGLDVAACAVYGDFGPYRVGVRRIEVGDEVAEIWYPVDREYDATERWDYYDMREWLPQDEREKIDDPSAPLFMTRAVRDEALSGAVDRFPLVIFSHGFAAYRYQSSFLTTHLASWGYVVASTDHPSRTLAAVLTFRLPPDESPDQLRGLVDALAELDGDEDDDFEGRLDFDRVAVMGHSAGARTSSAVLDDPRFKGAILYAGTGAEEDNASNKPVFVLGGDQDGIIPQGAIRAFYDDMDGPGRYAMIARAGHLAFSDICLIARDQGGILPYARSFGINVPVFFDDLASDGCREEFLPPELAWSMINHISVAFLRDLFKEDSSPAVLEPDELETCFGDLLGDRDVK